MTERTAQRARDWLLGVLAAGALAQAGASILQGTRTAEAVTAVQRELATLQVDVRELRAVLLRPPPQLPP